MAYGPIDPARLQGEALRRWYLRSPAQIEEERRSAANRAYSDFSSQRAEQGAHSVTHDEENATPAPSERIWLPTGDNRRLGQRPRTDFQPPSPASNAGGYEFAAAVTPQRGFWDYWGVHGCANCHGYTPETLPPVGGHSPFPPDYSPRRGSSGSSSKPSWSDRPQCNQQFEADRKICQKAGSPQCWENSNRRLGHCNSTGEVSIPPLGFGPSGR